MSGRPNFAWIISPCSVTRSVPSIEPGGCDRIARYVGPPPRPTLPPRPWNSVTRDAVRAAGGDDLLLRPVELPRGRDAADVLRRIGVADHHFLPIAAGDARAIPGNRQQAVEDAPGGAKIARRLEQRHDAQRRRDAGAALQQLDGEHVRRRARPW